MTGRLRNGLSRPAVQGAMGAALVVALWLLVQAALPEAEAAGQAAPVDWGTTFLPVGPVLGPAPLTTGFIDLSYDFSHDEATINHWEWEFGDGSPTLVCFGAQCPTVYQVSHAYREPGWYDVGLVTGGTHEGEEFRPGLVRPFEGTVDTDIVGFHLRDNFLLLFSPSREWRALDAVAAAAGITHYFAVTESRVELIPADADVLPETLAEAQWIVVKIGAQP